MFRAAVGARDARTGGLPVASPTSFLCKKKEVARTRTPHPYACHVCVQPRRGTGDADLSARQERSRGADHWIIVAYRVLALPALSRLGERVGTP